MEALNIRDENIIVLETGSYTTHAGCPLLSAAAAALPANAELIFPMQGPTAIVPSSTGKGKNIVEDGKVVDWEGLEDHWKHVLTRLCKIEESKMNSSCAVLLVAPATWSLADVEHAVQICFEGLNVPAVYVAEQPVVSLYATGQLTGLVIDIGHGGTKISPVLDGIVHYPAVEYFAGLGGCRVHETLQKLLKRNPEKFEIMDDDEGLLETAQLASLIIEGGHLMLPPSSSSSSYSNTSSSSITSYTSPSSHHEIHSNNSNPSHISHSDDNRPEYETVRNEWKEIELQVPVSIEDGVDSIIVSSSSSKIVKLKIKKSILFDAASSLLGGHLSLMDAISIVAGKLPKDKTSTLMENTLITGYVSLLPGLVQRLGEEYATNVAEDVNDLQPKKLGLVRPVPEYLGEGFVERAKSCWSSWIGASFVAKLVFNDSKNYITRADYNNLGPRISHRKPI